MVMADTDFPKNSAACSVVSSTRLRKDVGCGFSKSLDFSGAYVITVKLLNDKGFDRPEKMIEIGFETCDNLTCLVKLFWVASQCTFLAPLNGPVGCLRPGLGGFFIAASLPYRR